MFILYFIEKVGKITISACSNIGYVFLFLFKCLFSKPTFYFKQIRKQCFSIGYFSIAVVGLTALFTGMVLALQSYTGFSRFSAETAVATVVVLSMTRELGPVLAGLMVAGRVGASIAAEIGTMRVTEQIDALQTLTINPLHYLILPRIIAGVTMLPILVIIADIIGVFGGFLVSIYKLGFSEGNYLEQTLHYLKFEDVSSGLIKAAFFGLIITFMGCYHGFHSKGGAAGVGKATTGAVVSSSILILIMNYALTAILFER